MKILAKVTALRTQRTIGPIPYEQGRAIFQGDASRNLATLGMQCDHDATLDHQRLVLSILLLANADPQEVSKAVDELKPKLNMTVSAAAKKAFPGILVDDSSEIIANAMYAYNMLAALNLYLDFPL